MATVEIVHVTVASRLWRVLVFPGDEKNQPDAGADGGVGDVEGGKTDVIAAALLQVKIKKIHDRVAAGQQAVGEVAGDAAENQAERNLAGQRVGIKMMPREKQRDEREQGDDGECNVVIFSAQVSATRPHSNYAVRILPHRSECICAARSGADPVATLINPAAAKFPASFP